MFVVHEIHILEVLTLDDGEIRATEDVNYG